MAANEFLARFGFDTDPFESTNAEAEPLLDRYFVPPPYFPTVRGDPAAPASQVVLAPRGGGKTAQKRMIEAESAATERFLCIAYDRFDQPPGFRPTDADLAYHLNQVNRLILLGVLLALEEDPTLTDRLDANDRRLLKKQTDRFLGPLSLEDFEWAMRSIKSLGDKLADLWRKYGTVVAVATDAILAKAGLAGVHVPSEVVSEARADDNLRFHFDNLVRIARVLGFESVYVLVDRVDETASTTTDADSTFALIRPLLTELSVLETPGAGFKFFLWDRIEMAYRADGARPDRVPILRLHWTIAELQDMLSSRLRAFSGGAIDSLNSLLCTDSRLDVHALVSLLAGESPRDMIRLSKAIVNEETRGGTSSTCISDAAVLEGLRRFADDRALELAPAVIDELKRIGRCTFTINYLASEVFHVNSQSARAKVQQWMNQGVVEQIGEIPNPRGRPTHLYGIVDMRVGIAAMSGLDADLVLGTVMLECPNCGAIVMSDAEDLRCTDCGREFDMGKARSLLQVCTR